MLGSLKIMDHSGHRLVEIHEDALGKPQSGDRRAEVADIDKAAEEFRRMLDDEHAVAWIIGREGKALPADQRVQTKQFDPHADFLISPQFQGG